MRVQFTVGVYQAPRARDDEWIALIPARYTAQIDGKGDARLRERMIERLREVLRKAAPLDQDLFQLPLGTELVHLPIDLKAHSGRIHGTVPLIAEPRWTGDGRQCLMVYHPRRRHEWFLAADSDELAGLAPAFFRRYWPELD